VLARLRRDDTSVRPPDARLTAREHEVLRLAAAGMGNQRIAAELVLSPRTVQAHLGNIFGKLQVASRTEAVLHGLRRGWFHLEDLP
jgi:two-component system, NarL family, response regulator LiaR